MKMVGRTPIPFAATILLLLAGFSESGPGRKNCLLPPASAPQEKIADRENRQVDVRLVLVDVIASKDGEFFPGLKKSDFSIFEDGVEVPVKSCDLVILGKSKIRPAEETAGSGETPPVIVRKKRLAVLFDGINSGSREFKKTVQRISDELVAMAREDTEVMILVLDEAHGLRMVQPFTDQEELIREAAEKASSKKFIPFLEYMDYDGSLMAARYMEKDLRQVSGDLERDLLEMRAFEHINAASDALTRTMGGLLASIHMLESLPGRKNLLFVSGGFPDVDSYKIDPERSLPLSRRFIIYDPFGILGNKMFWTGSEVLKEIIRVANDRNISVYSLDPEVASRFAYAGPTAEYFDREGGDSQKDLFNEKYRQLQNLEALSDKTGAKLLRGSDKIESFRQISANEFSGYYQLSYAPPRKKADQRYHKIEVRLRNRKGVQVKTREGYSDSFADQSLRLLLARAFYNPELYEDMVPFEAGFIPFASESGKIQPWMCLSLPVREFFEGRVDAGKKTFEFHFWIKGDDKTGRMITGRVAVPFEMDGSFKSRLAGLDFLRIFYAGPGMELEDEARRVIFALFDPETGDIGTWISDFPQPFEKGGTAPAFLNGVAGYAVASPEDRGESFSLNPADGSLECGRIKFFPKTSGAFSPAEKIHLFFQVYAPGGIPGSACFELADRDGQAWETKGTPAAESWNRTSKIWSAVYMLDSADTAPGEYMLKIALPSTTDKPGLIHQLRLTIGDGPSQVIQNKHNKPD